MSPLLRATAGILAGFLLGWSLPARACSICGCGDPLLAASYPDHSRYRFGNAVLWSVHAQYRPIPRLALDLGLDGRHARADRAVDADGTVEARVQNTGGTVISVSPAVYGRATEKLWLFVWAQLPAIQHLAGNQDVKPTYTTGVQFQVF